MELKPNMGLKEEKTKKSLLIPHFLAAAHYGMVILICFHVLLM